MWSINDIPANRDPQEETRQKRLAGGWVLAQIDQNSGIDSLTQGQFRTGNTNHFAFFTKKHTWIFCRSPVAPSLTDYMVYTLTLILWISFFLDETFNYRYAIDGIALLIVAIFGIIGTIMSSIVLLKPHICKRKKRLQRSFSTYSSVSHGRENYFSIFLTALCIFDCCFLLMSIFYIALPSISCW